VAGGGLLVARRRHAESRTNCGPGEAVPRCDALCGCAAGGAKLAADQQRAVVSQPEASNGTIDPEAEGHVGRAVPASDVGGSDATDCGELAADHDVAIRQSFDGVD